MTFTKVFNGEGTQDQHSLATREIDYYLEHLGLIEDTSLPSKLRRTSVIKCMHFSDLI